MIEIVDRLRLLLDAASAAGTADDSCADPVAWGADTLYVFEAENGDLHEPVGDGSEDRELFEVIAVYIADAAGENQMTARHRDVSVALDQRKEAYLRAVRENRTMLDDGGVELWADLRGRADMGFVRAIQVRGVAVRIAGYRFIPPLI